MMTIRSFFVGTQESRLLCRTTTPQVEIFDDSPFDDKKTRESIDIPVNTFEKPSEVFLEADADSELTVAPSVDAGLDQLDSKAKKAALVPAVVKGGGESVPESTEPATPLTPDNTEITTSQESELVTLVKKTGKEFAENYAENKGAYWIGGIAGFIGAKWLWEKFVGSKEHDGIFKKTGSWLVAILTVVVGATLVSNIKAWWNKKSDSPWSSFTSFLASPLSFLGITKPTDTPPPGSGDPKAPKDGIFESPSGALSAGRDMVQGAGEAANTLIVEPIKGTAEIVNKIVQGHPLDALILLKDKGWSLFINEKVEIVILDTFLLPISAPIKATKNMLTTDGRKSEEFWIVWGGSGGAYLIAKKTAALWKSGAHAFPSSLNEVVTGGIADFFRVLGGPLQPSIDALSTLRLMLNPSGRRALALRYGQQSFFGKMFLDKSNNIFSLVINSEENALQLLSKYERLSEDLRVVRKFSKGRGTTLFEDTEVASLDNIIGDTIDSVLKYLKKTKDLKNPILQKLRASVAFMDFEAEEARKEAAKIIAEMRGKTLTPSFQATEILDDVVDSSRIGDAVSDSTKAAYVVDEASDVLPFPNATSHGADVVPQAAVGAEEVADATSDAAKAAAAVDVIEEAEVLPFPRAAQALPDSGLAHAVGDGVESLPQAAVATEEVAEVANPNELKIFDPNAAVAPVESVESVSAPVKAVEASAVASAIDTVGDLQQTQIAALMKQKAIASGLAQIGDSGSIRFKALCERFSPDTLIQFNRSPKAQGLLIGALQAADETEATRLVQAATKAGGVMRSISAGAGALGFAGDAFSIAIAIADFQEYGNKIQATKNPALAEFYSHCQLLCAAEGTASAVGLAYQGMAFVGSIKAGGGIVTALGTPAGLIALPVTLAAVGVGLARRGLQESVEYHSLSEQEMLSYPPGKIIEHIAKSTSTSNLNWTQGLFLENSVLANRSAREEAYCGYFRQIAIESVAPYSFDELDEEKRSLIESKNGAERDALERQALLDAHRTGMSQLVLDAYQYAKLVDSNYEKPPVQTLKYAEIFAKLQSVRRRSGQELLPLSLEKINFEISKHLLSQAEDTAKILPLLSQYPERAAEMFLSLVRHDLALAEYNILSTDYSNTTQISTDETMQAYARGMLAEEIWNTLRSVTRKLRETGTISPQEVESTLKSLRVTLLPKRDVNALAIECSKKGNAAYFQHMGQMPGRLSILGLRDLINMYRFTKPDELGVDQSAPLPNENLTFYYSDKIKANAPIYLKLPPGKTQGFLSLEGAYWMRHSAHADIECTQVTKYGERMSIAVEKGIYQFWKQSSMPVIDNIVPPVDPTPVKPPDFSIIVE